MKIIDNIKNIFKRSNENNININPNPNNYFDNIDLKYFRAEYGLSDMQVATVFRCVNIISSTIASLRINKFVEYNEKKTEIKDHLSYLLNIEPSKDFSQDTFINRLIHDLLLKGNAYAYISRNDENGNVKNLTYIPADTVLIKYDTQNVFDRKIKYVVSGINREIEDFEMIHLINQTKNGIEGISTLRYAFDCIET